MNAVRVFTASARVGWADFTALYTVRTWMSTWLLRVLLQVTFFASLGLVLPAPAALSFLLIGNAVAILSLEAAVTVLSVAAERWQGTLAGLASSPAPLAAIFWGRGIHYVLTGVVSATTCLLLLPLAFRVDVPVVRLLSSLPVLVLIGTSCYSYAIFLASFALRWPSLTWLALNVGYLVITVIGGVSVPTAFWPDWVQALALVLPLTNGLVAVRGLLMGEGYAEVAGRLLAEIGVGVFWSALGLLAYGFFIRSVRSGRREVF